VNLVGHNIELIKELKIHMLKRIDEYNSLGFIKEDKYEELVEYETKKMDERLKMMGEWL
jgi:hypothetical protein